MNWKLIGTAVAVLLVLYGVYTIGYNKAEAEGELALTEQILAQEQAVRQAKEQERQLSDEKINTLMAELDRISADNERLRQLEAFRNAGRDLQACRRDRSDLAEVAVGMEKSLKEADAYFDAWVRGKP